jgi:hypothetical protein
MTTRLRTRAGLTSRSLTADLEALGWSLDYRQSSRLALTLESLIGELAALTEMADGNKSPSWDSEGRSGTLASEMPIPNFDPAAAARELGKAEQRLWQEYEKLAGVVRRPQRAPRPKCTECGKRERLVDVVCGPCGAAILKAARRAVNDD